jgi:hypothetical protein
MILQKKKLENYIEQGETKVETDEIRQQIYKANAYLG